jgi:outer membrane lipoprotein-sorting protein
MNENSLLERELDQLGRTLRGAPSVASAVLARIRESGAEETVVELPPSGRTRTLAGIAMSVASLAAVMAVMFFLRSDGIAFAQIQKRLTAIQTASFRYQTSAENRDETQKRTNDAQVKAHSDGRMRAELSDRSLIITNRRLGKRLETDENSQTATLSYVFENQDGANLLALLQSLPENISAQRIASKQINGEHCVGYLIDKSDLVLRVWVSPNSLLPVHAEYTPADKPRPSDQRDSDQSQFVTTFSDIRFGESFADDLFNLQPPANYVVSVIGKLPVPLSEIFATTPRIVPLEGIGPFKLGMTKSEATKLLGVPDRESVSKPALPPIGEDTDQIDDQPRPSKTSRPVMLTEYHSLHYFDLGLRLDFEVREGLIGLMFDKKVRLAETAEFPGLLAEGIGLGSSEQQVIEAYGEPTSITGASKSILIFQNLGLLFQMSEQRTVAVIGIENGGEKKYRFEWREPSERDVTDGK